MLNETYAGLLDQYGVEGFPARSKKPRDKALVENGMLHGERWTLAAPRNHFSHNLASLSRAISHMIGKRRPRPERTCAVPTLIESGYGTITHGGRKMTGILRTVIIYSKNNIIDRI